MIGLGRMGVQELVDGERDFADKVISAMRQGFCGHAGKAA